MPEFEPLAIIRVLVEHGVDGVFIGGFAAFLQGSPIPTTDVDLTPSADVDTLTRLSAALYALNAKVRAAELDEPLPFHHDATSLAASRVWNLTTTFGDLDISFVPSGTTGYDDLKRDAVTVNLGSSTVRLASLADIVRSKEAAGRDKDRRALPVLRELLARQKPGR